MPVLMAAQQPTLIEALRTTVQDDLVAADDTIRRELASDVALVNQVSGYIIGAGGKRLRPLLVLLAARAAGANALGPHVLGSVVIEFIHTATLLHDDVVDGSGQRRGRRTANSVWGNAASVLVGDFLYSKSFRLLTEYGNLDIINCAAIAAAEEFAKKTCSCPP